MRTALGMWLSQGKIEKQIILETYTDLYRWVEMLYGMSKQHMLYTVIYEKAVFL